MARAEKSAGFLRSGQPLKPAAAAAQYSRGRGVVVCPQCVPVCLPLFAQRRREGQWDSAALRSAAWYSPKALGAES